MVVWLGLDIIKVKLPITAQNRFKPVTKMLTQQENPTKLQFP